MWLLAVVLLMVMALGPSRSARGDEGGVSFWTPGQYASLAAVPANPGWLLQTELYYYGGSADSSKNFTRGEHVTAGLDSTTALPSVSQFLAENWQVGIAGYLYYQLTGDSGSGATLGAFESKVAAIGPEIGYQFEIGGRPVIAAISSP